MFWNPESAQVESIRNPQLGIQNLILSWITFSVFPVRIQFLHDVSGNYAPPMISNSCETSEYSTRQ